MSISYIPKTITGIRLDGIDSGGLREYLAKHGYELTDEEYDQIQNEGWESFTSIKKVDFWIECQDGWSGDGWTIGFESEEPASLEIMKAAFPDAEVGVFEYVQLM